jgi:N6-adenosine-specific RNA methylase IME4
MVDTNMFPDKKYNIIYADPAWTYDKSGGIKSARGLAKKYYTTMAIEDIKNLPVSNIADHNCYLFLWATAPNIQQALDTLEAWGFKLFTIVFTWIKINKKSDSLFWGMGNSSRANPEYVLLGRKGKLKRIDAGVHSVVQERIQEHSKKPDEVRKRIIRLYGDIPRIELFAREKVEGWDSWGLEV